MEEVLDGSIPIHLLESMAFDDDEAILESKFEKFK